MEHELITMDHPWMQKLVKLTNRHCVLPSRPLLGILRLHLLVVFNENDLDVDEFPPQDLVAVLDCEVHICLLEVIRF